MKCVISLIILLGLVSCQSTNTKRGIAQTTPDVQVRILPLDSAITFANKLTFPPGATAWTFPVGHTGNPITSTLFCKFTSLVYPGSRALPKNQALQINSNTKYTVVSAQASPSYIVDQSGNVVVNRQASIPVVYNLRGPNQTMANMSMACDTVPSSTTGVIASTPNPVIGNTRDFSGFSNISVLYGTGSSVLNIPSSGEILPIRYDQPINQQDNGTAI